MKRYKKLSTLLPVFLNKEAVFHDNYMGRELPSQIELKNKMIEDPSGDWVKWEDVKGIDRECNCKDYAYANDPSGCLMYADSWICPAHGYKRR